MMKKLIIITLILLSGSTAKEADNSSKTGIIPNPSAEITDGSVVKDWTSDQRARYSIHFYDNIAHDGNKSLFIKAGRFANGRWSAKVLFQPWSKYNDRKFWYIPGTRESVWKLTGENSLFSMDKANLFTGTHSPVLECQGDKKVILVQEDLGLKEDLDYNGRIILKASGKIEKVTVTLKWDSGSEIATLSGLSDSYTTFPLNFHSSGLVHNATLSIEPFGSGKVWVGTVSVMPSDNIEGFRNDVIALLRELNSPVYRWPGGNFVSGYNWRDGIGDRDRRPPRKNPAWTGVEANDVGIHEFMRFCELINTEPYIAVNAGLGNSQEAAAEVEYTNGGPDTPMGKLRSVNGRSEPWKVKWWSIANEMYGDWQLGHMSTSDFVS